MIEKIESKFVQLNIAQEDRQVNLTTLLGNNENLPDEMRNLIKSAVHEFLNGVTCKMGLFKINRPI